MTNERLFSGDAKFLRIASSAEEKDWKVGIVTDIAQHDWPMMDKTPKHRPPSAIQRLLDSLKLSSKLRGNSKEREVKKPRVQYPITKEVNGRSTSGHLAHEGYKHAAIWTSGSHCPAETETFDSSSDSAYSQCSDTSANSDLRSQNTTSTDSENNQIYKEGTAARDRVSLKNNSDVLDVEEGFLRRVLMLMKVVLYLRHSFPLNIIRKKKISPENTSNQIKSQDSSSLSSCESGESCDSGVFSGKSPRSRKRISFSPITLLFSAITERAYEEAKAILEEQEVDVNFQTPNGQSLLHIAASNADLKSSQLLLQYGADVNVKDIDGWGPLHAAVRRGNWKCAILLIEAGADFGEYAQARIQEYNQVQRIATTFYRSVEIYV